MTKSPKQVTTNRISPRRSNRCQKERGRWTANFFSNFISGMAHDAMNLIEQPPEQSDQSDETPKHG